MFQSLFYWKLLWKVAIICSFWVIEQSFNPYSIGSYFGRSNTWSAISQASMFQSLFYWKLLWKNTSKMKTSHNQKCFNPYSIGSYFGSDKVNTMSAKMTNVSILILLEVTLEVSSHKFFHIYRNKFQSLFYWKLLWKLICAIASL